MNGRTALVAANEGSASLEISAALNERVRSLGGAAPPKNESPGHHENIVEADIVEAGREAWQRRKDEPRHCRKDWYLIGGALNAGRERAMKLAAKSKPEGKNYDQHFSHWLKLHHFDDIDSSDVRKAIWMFENQDKLEAFISSFFPADKQQRLNHPSAVWKAWKCPNRGGRWRAEQERAAETHDDGANTTVPVGEFEHDTESDDDALTAAPLRAGPLVLKANKAAGLADDCRQFSGKVDAALLRAVKEAVDAWSDIRDLFEERFREES
jgi:hypothetical protein